MHAAADRVARKLFRCAHVAEIGGAGLVLQPGTDFGGGHCADVKALHQALCGGARGGQAGGVDLIGITAGRLFFQFQVGEVPALGAVFESHHRVGDAEINQGLRADDGTGAPCAVDDNFRFRVRCERGDTIRQLGVGAADAAGDVHLLIFVERTTVDDDEVFAGLLHTHQFLRGDARRVAGMFDQFTECFARHVDAAKQAVTCRRPSAYATVQQRDIGVAQGLQFGCSPRRDSGVAIVAQNDACALARHQAEGIQFEPAVGQRCGEEQMRFAKLAGFANVQQGDFGAVVQHVFQFCGADATVRVGHGMVLDGLRSGSN